MNLFFRNRMRWQWRQSFKMILNRCFSQLRRIYKMILDSLLLLFLLFIVLCMSIKLKDVLFRNIYNIPIKEVSIKPRAPRILLLSCCRLPALEPSFTSFLASLLPGSCLASLIRPVLTLKHWISHSEMLCLSRKLMTSIIFGELECSHGSGSHQI